MTTKLITTALAHSKESALEAKLFIMSSAFLTLCGLIALSARKPHPGTTAMLLRFDQVVQIIEIKPSLIL
jgi:hypothetical protein